MDEKGGGRLLFASGASATSPTFSDLFNRDLSAFRVIE
jgi:hypothetical protein